MKKIRVLVVDDSIFFRETLVRTLSEDAGIEIVGTAPDAIMAFKEIEQKKPDVVTVDIEMPGMSGIEFIKKLMPKYPIPIIVVSSINEKVFEAMSAGAIDFVLKPGTNSFGIKSFVAELGVKIKIASVAKIKKSKDAKDMFLNTSLGSFETQKVIAIGASTGGTEAILKVLKDLPPDMPGIVIVQHIPPVFSKMFAERLNNMCSLKVKEAINGDEVLKGTVLVAPGDYHMKLTKKDGKYFVRCSKGEKVNGHCPSVDVLFDSVAEVAGSNAVGVIMTGMGNDGATGLLNMKKKGAYTIGQDEASAVVYGMPMVANKLGAVTKQLPLNRIAEALIERF